MERGGHAADGRDTVTSEPDGEKRDGQRSAEVALGRRLREGATGFGTVDA